MASSGQAVNRLSSIVELLIYNLEALIEGLREHGGRKNGRKQRDGGIEN